jgi:dUTP pyrophosphatase
MNFITNQEKAYIAGYIMDETYLSGNKTFIDNIASSLSEYYGQESASLINEFDDEKVYYLPKIFHSQNLCNKDLDEKTFWSITRGKFDRRGIIDPNDKCCRLIINSAFFKQPYFKIKYEMPEPLLFIFKGSNAIDFLSKLYDTNEMKDEGKYKMYVNFVGYEDTVPNCKISLKNEKAIFPSKNNASDEGYDLWLVDEDKKISSMTMRYETYVAIEPPRGYHIRILPRSSLSNSGYMLSNSIGLIDQSYRGTLKVCLTKIDPSMPDITLPCKCVQFVLEKSHHFTLSSEDLTDTQRGNGGFGSTN